MRLNPGQRLPRFETQDFLGQTVSSDAFVGKRLLLSFYRYASCPLCNLRMRELILAHPQLQAQGIELIAIFQSTAESIGEYVGGQDAPFPIVPDPTQQLYRQFGVEARWTGLLGFGVIGQAFKAMLSGLLPGRIDGPLHRLPADFWIDETGVIQIAHYGKTIDDHLPLAELGLTQ